MTSKSKAKREARALEQERESYDAALGELCDLAGRMLALLASNRLLVSQQYYMRMLQQIQQPGRWLRRPGERLEVQQVDLEKLNVEGANE